MSTQIHPQGPNNYPHARSGSDQDIIAAAESRAKFWRYNPDGPWTVYVNLGKRVITVSKTREGTTSITR